MSIGHPKKEVSFYTWICFPFLNTSIELRPLEIKNIKKNKNKGYNENDPKIIIFIKWRLGPPIVHS